MNEETQTTTIVLVDFGDRGHHLVYLREISRSLVIAGANLVIFFPNEAENRPKIEEVLPRGRLLAWRSPPNHLVNPISRGLWSRWEVSFARWRWLAATTKKIGSPSVRRIVLLMADQLLERGMHGKIIDAVVSFPWVPFWFYPSEYRRTASKFPSWFETGSGLKSIHCKGCAVLDEGLIDVIQNHRKVHVIGVPDIADTTSPGEYLPDWFPQPKKEDNIPIVCLLGELSPRKGLREFINLAKYSKERKWNAIYVAAGKIRWEAYSAEEQDDLRVEISSIVKDKGNLVIHDGVLRDGKVFNSCIRGSSVLIACYINFLHSSNIMTKAAFFGKPIVVSPGGLMEERVKKYNIGEVVNDLNVDSVFNSVQHALIKGKLAYGNGLKSYSKDHSTDKLKQLANYLVHS